MPPIINDWSVLKRYGTFALDGVAVPVCGCVVGAVYHLLGGLWSAVGNWHSKSWASARIDYHVALEAFRNRAPK